MTAKRKTGKGAPSGALDLADIPDPTCDDSPEGRRCSVAWFVQLVRDGTQPPRWLLERVAAILAERMDAVAPLPAHRPRKSREAKFLAWFAVECDPDFQNLPRTRDRRFHAIGQLLSCDPTKVQNDARAFARSRKGTDFLLVQTMLGERYAGLKGLQWPGAMLTFRTFLHRAKNRPCAPARKRRCNVPR